MLQKLLILIVCFMPYTGFSQSKIRKAEESLKKEKKNTKATTQSGRGLSNDDDSLGEVIVKETFGRLAVTVFYYTAYGILVEMPFEKKTPSSNAVLNKHPYFNTENGNYSYQWNASSAVGRTSLSSRYVFENSILDGHHLNLDIRFYNKLALEFDYLQLWENNPNFGHDELAIYTALLKYHRVRTKKLDAWWGVGASYVDGAVDDFGFTFGLGAEAFFAKPISLESNFNHTAVNGNSITKFNALINYYLKQFKISGGYERLIIGNQKFSMPSIGLGVSF